MTKNHQPQANKINLSLFSRFFQQTFVQHWAMLVLNAQEKGSINCGSRVVRCKFFPPANDLRRAIEIMEESNLEFAQALTEHAETVQIFS